jgi:CRP/FNR family transcriptional regulator
VIASDELRQFPLFATLDAPTLHDAARQIERWEYRSGEFIVYEGDPATGLLLVQSGRVRLSRSSADGREQVLTTVGPGAQLNAAAMFDDQPCFATARAMSLVQCLLLPRTAIVHLIRCHPDLAVALLREMSSQIRELVLLVDDLAFHSVRERMARHLLREAAEGTAQLTQQELAERVGTVREIAGRALRQFAHEGLIRLARGQVIVINYQGLARVAEGSDSAHP